MYYLITKKEDNKYYFEIRNRAALDDYGKLIAKGDIGYTTKDECLADLRSIFELTVSN